ncbi:MAG: asparagine synthase (glutamine-hydrolyzing) [Blastocatellia bacterium]
MCGITGTASPRQFHALNESRMMQMRDTLRHRGPDGAGLWMRPGVALGHRRLAIVDLHNGQQPMTNEDGTIHIVFNGEIYNHRELRPLLEAHGHQYRTNCDTETIIHLYEQFGAQCVQHLRGMFAFAIWDENRRQLLLARDRLGIKPLYYTLSDDGTIYFASEIKALLAAGAIRAELNHDALPDYLASRGTSGAETLYRGVMRLPPGHTLVWHQGRVRIDRYWEASFAKDERPASESEYVDEFGELLRDGVRSHLMADVPLGVFLSGGIDSSAIAALMSEQVTEPVKTFSVAFAEREANEFAYARMVARACRTEHHEITVTPDEFFAALPQLVWHEDEPLAHPSSIPLYFVAQLAAQRVRVVLTGEGSDELLAGYDKYRKTIFNLACGRLWQNAVPAAVRRSVRQMISARSATSAIQRKLSRTFLCLAPELEDIYFDNFAVFTRSAQTALLADETQARISERNPYRHLNGLTAQGADSLLDRLLAIDLKTYLHELLMKQDQMSMAASIESRVPFLDHRLVEFAARLPVNLKLRGLTTKYILRRAMRDVLPPEILSRRKMGFPVPVGAWLRGRFRHLLDEYVLSERAMQRGVFNPADVRGLVARHLAGENQTERLWMLMNFEIWQRRFFDGEATNQKLPELQTMQISTAA